MHVKIKNFEVRQTRVPPDAHGALLPLAAVDVLKWESGDRGQDRNQPRSRGVGHKCETTFQLHFFSTSFIQQMACNLFLFFFKEISLTI